MGGPELRGRAPHVEPPVDATAPTSPDLSDYLGLLRRQWWVVLLVTLFVVGTAYGITQAMPREYESVTSVLVQPAGQDTNVVGGRTKGEINLDTEAQLVRSTAIAAGAASLLRATEAPDDLARGVAVEVPPNTVGSEDQVHRAGPVPRPDGLARVRRGVPAQPRRDRAGRHRRPGRRADVEGEAAQRDADAGRHPARQPVRVEPAAAGPGEPARPRRRTSSTTSARRSTTSPR